MGLLEDCTVVVAAGHTVQDMVIHYCVAVVHRTTVSTSEPLAPERGALYPGSVLRSTPSSPWRSGLLFWETGCGQGPEVPDGHWPLVRINKTPQTQLHLNVASTQKGKESNSVTRHYLMLWGRQILLILVGMRTGHRLIVIIRALLLQKDFSNQHSL